VGAARAPEPDAVPSRFLFYSHDGLGLGHMRRNLCVASALSELSPRASILVATSAEEAELFGIPPRIDLLKLPGLRKIDNGRYAARRLPLTGEEVRSVRAHLLTAAVESFRPDVVLVDKHPFGVGDELLPALEAAREARARLVLGLRDVLDDPLSVRAEWHSRHLYERIPEYYDRVLVYGQPEILDPRRAYAFPAPVSALTRFCGYVVSSRQDNTHENRLRRTGVDRPFVLATAGGGEDGFALLSTFIEAASTGRWQAVAVTGPQCSPEPARRLRTLAAEAGVSFRRFVPNVSRAFPYTNALVCMGGYNTLVEAVASGVPTVCVPRIRPRTEQLIRARSLERFGLVRVVEPQRLDAAVLRLEVEAALREPADPAGRDSGVLDLGGARRAALHLRQLATAAGRARRPAEAVSVV
jgi:predicted glycosyltransferase